MPNLHITGVATSLSAGANATFYFLLEINTGQLETETYIPEIETARPKIETDPPEIIIPYVKISRSSLRAFNWPGASNQG